MSNLKKAAFGAVTLILLSGAMAGAQMPGRGLGVSGKESKEDGKAVKVFKIDEVGKMLKDLGYKVNTVKLDGKFIIHELDIPAKGMTVPLDVSLSPDGTKVWLTVNCGKIPQAGIPANILQQMLETNGLIGPNHFVMGKNGNLYLQCAVDNRSLAPEQLKLNIEQIALNIADTENLWNPGKWAPQVGGGR